MELQIIHCADCGQSHEVRRSNAKYCPTCRLFRNLVYLKGRTTKCVSCEDRFAVMHANDNLCSKCDFLSENNPRGHCAICKAADVRLVKGALAVCLACAKSEEHRDTVLRSLAQRRRKQMAANDRAPVTA
jgi:hypothetical protein